MQRCGVSVLLTCMNDNRDRDSWWLQLLDGASSGIDVFSVAGEILGFIGEAMVTVLSALIEVLPGL
jgi:hypothetical protein